MSASAEIRWIAADPASRRVLELAEKVAGAATTVLVTGESGKGAGQLRIDGLCLCRESARRGNV